MKLLVIKNIMIDTMILLMLSFLYFTPLWCNIFDSIILLYSTYRLKINFKFHTNPHHFLIDFILIISYALFLFMIKISLFTYLNVVLYIFLFSIKLSYVVYNTTFLEGLYNNYIDFYNINIKIFIPFAMFYVLFIMYYNYEKYIIPLSYGYSLCFATIQPLINYRKKTSAHINFFYIPEILLCWIMNMLIFLIK